MSNHIHMAFTYNQKANVLDQLSKYKHLIESLFFLSCQYCGIRSGDVSRTHDPYDLEIHQIYNEVAICGDCYGQRSDEI